VPVSISIDRSSSDSSGILQCALNSHALSRTTTSPSPPASSPSLFCVFTLLCNASAEKYGNLYRICIWTTFSLFVYLSEHVMVNQSPSPHHFNVNGAASCCPNCHFYIFIICHLRQIHFDSLRHTPFFRVHFILYFVPPPLPPFRASLLLYIYPCWTWFYQLVACGVGTTISGRVLWPFGASIQGCIDTVIERRGTSSLCVWCLCFFCNDFNL